MSIYTLSNIKDYWDIREETPLHPISRRMSRNRYQEIHMRFRITTAGIVDIFERVEPLSQHLQTVNSRLWKPGLDIAADECMILYTGRASEVTVVPNKPIPRGLKA